MPNRRTLPTAAPTLPPAVALAVAVVVAGGCVSDGGTQPTDADGVEPTAPISVTIPAERQTPFCLAMIDLNERTVTANSDDVGELIVDTYRELLPMVPDEIGADFRAVLRSLETGEPPPTAPPVTQPDLPVGTVGAGAGTVTPDTADYYFPATTPTQRVNEYVSFACQDSQNNPGPPPTEPQPDRPDDTGAGDG